MSKNGSVYQEDLKVAITNSMKINQLAGKSILVTGATGTIGSFLVDELLMYNSFHKNKIEIFATSRKLKNLQRVFQEKATNKLHFIEFDNQKLPSFQFKVDYIIHNAGNAYPEAFKKDPIGTMMGNINGTYNLLTYAKQMGTKRFLYVSSGEVYGQESTDITKFGEEHTGHIDPLNSRSCYPNSKRACETLCASFAEQNHLDIVVVRPCHTYGPRITNNDNRAHVQFLKAALEDKTIVLKSLGNQLRSYCYVADCVAGIITVLLKGQTKIAYNIANVNSITTVKSLAEEIAMISKKKIVFKCLDQSKNDSPIQYQVLSSDRLEDLGWQGQYDLTLGITHTLNIMKQERNKEC
ncbi:NAD-dependent epimerase/dehydratase family protein [Ligilactobacillus sp. WILCCON 0076]|uniref:NAD-dependent epimerase/dehydratase family protein n=1 Tax=Ligilactobacillus ubinensis TaxID=2876789 RepID=A0A9X2FJM1_9LACO|nr:NAD-dependent epimerase/dehydratase family protein [Ligilactobacillus ubinensis]MCP0886871.1 NAD-dependent epimerase/dehydratase family protein [Ligilactobacillus ubinensis]